MRVDDVTVGWRTPVKLAASLLPKRKPALTLHNERENVQLAMRVDSSSALQRFRCQNCCKFYEILAITAGLLACL